jgi:large subunit ribosomal protein L10
LVEQSKITKAEELREKFSATRTAVMADYRGLNVQQMNDLRRRLREHSVEYKVVKNTLARRASIETDFQAVEELFTGPVSIAFCSEDKAAAAKVMTGFAREEAALEITGGLLDGRPITAEEVRKLAALPPEEVLLSQVLAAMKSPMAGLVGALSGVMRSFIYTLKAVEEKKSAQG